MSKLRGKKIGDEGKNVVHKKEVIVPVCAHCVCNIDFM